MPAGRPRTVSLSPDEMIALGEEMIEWVIVNDPIHLSKWYCIHKGYTDKQWDAMQQVPEFLPYYEAALKLVGYKYLERDTDIEPSLKQRWLRVYFKDLRKQENDDMDADAARKKAVEGSKQTTINISVPHDLAAGSNISASTVSNTLDKSPQ